MKRLFPYLLLLTAGLIASSGCGGPATGVQAERAGQAGGAHGVAPTMGYTQPGPVADPGLAFPHRGDIYGVAPGLAAQERARTAHGGTYRGPADSVPPSPDTRAADEYLVIAQSDAPSYRIPQDRAGMFVAGDATASEPSRSLPLKRTDVDGRVRLHIGAVTVTQQYHNPYDTKIEAVYAFPLPQSAAVSDFVMVIGERRIRGIIREKEEARRIYEEARDSGLTASLLSQERPNIFQQRVANIEPGKAVDVEITYYQTLAFRDGGFDLVVPTTIGPRFNPPDPEAVDVPPAIAYDTPDEVPGHLIDIRFAIDAGLPLGDVQCATHGIDVTRTGPTSATVALRHGPAVPNRDFALRFEVAAEGLTGAVALHRTGETGRFAMLLYPPAGLPEADAGPVEYVFVVDTSGSMDGEPIALCKGAMRRLLDRMEPGDAFNIVRFSNSPAAMAEHPIAVTPANVRRGRRFVDDLEAGGGTMMVPGMELALSMLRDPEVGERRRIVVFMTDGFIGNEADVLAMVHRHLGAARIFSFGVGSSPNRFLLERMAQVGRGVAAYVGAGSDDAVDALFRRVASPALADLELDWHGATVDMVEPGDLPDLYPGAPVVIHGRVRGTLPERVTVRGRMGAESASFDVPVGEPVDHPAITGLWARARIAGLYTKMAWLGQASEAQRGELTGEIRSLALTHNLMSAFTSFVAVDSMNPTEGDHGITVPVPAQVPQGVRYETTVGATGGGGGGR